MYGGGGAFMVGRGGTATMIVVVGVQPPLVESDPGLIILLSCP
jgi:hypothetical protein